MRRTLLEVAAAAALLTLVGSVGAQPAQPAAAPPAGPASAPVAQAPVAQVAVGTQPTGPVAPTAGHDDLWWHNIPKEEPGPAKTVVTAVGGVVTGLGVLSLFAASITWLTAWSESRTLDNECSGGYCVEGTRGGDAYEKTRDLAKATDVLVATSLPMIGAGLSTLIIGASMRGDEGTSYARVTVRPTGAGASLEVTF